METQVKVRKWGNSYGILLPKEFLEKQNIRENSKIFVRIRKANDLSDVFGSFKEWKVDSQKVKDRIREEEKIKDEILSRHIRNNGNH